MSRYGNSRVAKGVYRRFAEKLDAGDKDLTSLVVKLSKLECCQGLERKRALTIKSYKDKLKSLATKSDTLRRDVLKESIHLGDLLASWSKIQTSIDRMSRRVEKIEFKIIENKSINSGVSKAAE